MSEVLDRLRADAEAAKQGRGRARWLREVAAATGINYRTLHSYIEYATRDGRGATIEKLQRFYASRRKASGR